MDSPELKAFTVSGIKVAAYNGSDAKVLAAPILRSNEEWCQDVTAWVALRAERDEANDHCIDQSQKKAYILES